MEVNRQRLERDGIWQALWNPVFMSMPMYIIVYYGFSKQDSVGCDIRQVLEGDAPSWHKRTPLCISVLARNWPLQPC